MKPIRLSLNQAADEFHTTRETIRRALLRLEIKPDAEGTYSPFDVHCALSGGDLKFERTRQARAEANRLEREEAIASKELCLFADVQAHFVEFLVEPVARALTDGIASGAVRQEWADNLRKTIREATK